MDCRSSSLDFDIAASAGWYSAIAGLLAGFALLSILLPLDHDAADQDESQTGEAVVVFTCAFFSLLVLGFSYAVLAGRTGDGSVLGVAAHEQMVYGSAFGLATILMLFGLLDVAPASPDATTHQRPFDRGPGRARLHRRSDCLGCCGRAPAPGERDRRTMVRAPCARRLSRRDRWRCRRFMDGTMKPSLVVSVRSGGGQGEALFVLGHAGLGDTSVAKFGELGSCHQINPSSSTSRSYS